MNKCLLEVAMCEKCRNSDFQSEEGRRVKSLSTAGEGGLKNFRTRGGLPINLSGGKGTFAWGSVPYYMQYNFHLPNDHFNCAKSKNNFYSRYRVTTRRHFWTQYGSLAPNNFFFWKFLIILIYLLAPFIVWNLKKLLPSDPELWGCGILGPKMTHFPKW